MKEGTKILAAACILSAGLIISAVIYAYSNRYEISRTNGTMPMRIDKWKNEWVGIKRIQPINE